PAGGLRLLKGRLHPSTLPASAVRVEDLCEPWMKPMLRWQYGLWMTSDVPQAGEGVPAAPALGRGRRPDGRRHCPVTLGSARDRAGAVWESPAFPRRARPTSGA